MKKTTSSLSWVLLASLSVACAGERTEGETVAAAPEASEVSSNAAQAPATTSVSLISREILFGNPERTAPQLSPDGKRIAFLAPVNNVLNVWVGPADDFAQAKPVTSDTKRGIRDYFWTYTNNHIVYLQDKDGDENWRAYAIDLVKGGQRDLTPFDGVRAQIAHVTHKKPKEILIGLNKRDPKAHDLYRVDITTGTMKLVAENKDNLADYIADDDLNVRIASKINDDGSSEILEPDAKKRGTWKSLLHVPFDDTMGTSPVDFTKDGKAMYLLDSRDRDTAALYTYDFKTKEKKLVAESSAADVGGIMMHPTEHTVQAVTFDPGRITWKILDPKIEADFASWKTTDDGDLVSARSSLDQSKWLLTFVHDQGPTKYYAYDRATKNAKLLFVNQPKLEGAPLSAMQAVTIRSRDNLDLPSYLTLPMDAVALQATKPAKPLPMVLLVHGGPWARDTWGFNRSHQWLANRGYAVLSVNYRGSTGFGKAFVNASKMQWAGTMHDDLLDAVDWAVKEGIADPKRVAIMGGSYGGYATLVGLTFTPDVFACGVDIVGPSNLATLLATIPPYWAPAKALFTSRVGDISTEEGKAKLAERSPLTKADKIVKPLLIGQGANDPRVKQAESDQIVTAMNAKNIPVTYVVFGDEGHGFKRPENSMAFNAVAEAFLAKHLGGRFEPVGDDFSGSSIDIKNGAELIPGLPKPVAAR